MIFPSKLVEAGRSVNWRHKQLWGENHVKTIFKIMAELCNFEYTTNWKSDFGVLHFSPRPLTKFYKWLEALCWLDFEVNWHTFHRKIVTFQLFSIFNQNTSCVFSYLSNRNTNPKGIYYIFFKSLFCYYIHNYIQYKGWLNIKFQNYV